MSYYRAASGEHDTTSLGGAVFFVFILRGTIRCRLSDLFLKRIRYPLSRSHAYLRSYLGDLKWL